MVDANLLYIQQKVAENIDVIKLTTYYVTGYEDNFALKEYKLIWDFQLQKDCIYKNISKDINLEDHVASDKIVSGTIITITKFNDLRQRVEEFGIVPPE